MINLSEVSHTSVVCDLETSTTKRPRPELDSWAIEIKFPLRIVPNFSLYAGASHRDYLKCKDVLVQTIKAQLQLRSFLTLNLELEGIE